MPGVDAAASAGEHLDTAAQRIGEIPCAVEPADAILVAGNDQCGNTDVSAKVALIGGPGAGRSPSVARRRSISFHLEAAGND